MKNKIQIFILVLLSPLGLFAQGSWLQKNDFPDPLGRYYGVSFTINGKGYFGTGTNGLFRTDLWEYDATTDTWTQKADIPVKRCLAVGFVISGKGYIALGDGNAVLNDLWEFDPVMNTWTQKSNLPATGRNGGLALVINNKAYVGMGYGPNIVFNDWWEYNPATDTWLQKNSFPIGGGRSAAASFTLNGFGYVFGGTDTLAGFLNDLWQYDATTDAWSQKASMPDTARNFPCAFELDNMGYVFGGNVFGYSFGTNDLWQYNSAANAWLAKAFLPSFGRWASSAFSLNGKGYIVAGVGYANGIGTRLNELWEYTPDSVFAGVNEHSNIAQLHVFPNPFQNIVQLTLPANATGNYAMKLCDASGKIIYNATLPANHVNHALSGATAALPKGVYFISILSDDKQFNLTDKIVKL